MNIVKVYCSDKDIKIKGVISHFMKYLGVYVVEIYDGKDNGLDSMCDIHIISKNYTSPLVFINDNKKNVFVLADGLDIDLRDMRKVYYSDSDMRTFLHDLIGAMQDALDHQKLLEKRLIYADTNYMQIISKMIDIYCKYEIFESSVYMYEYPADEDLFAWTISRLNDFIREIQTLQAETHSDLLDYAILQAAYEADIMRRKNSYILLFSGEEMVKTCDELLQKYASNEEIRLIKAGIYGKLLSFSAKAANEYGNAYLRYCQIAWLERSRVYVKIGDIQSAETATINALNLGKFSYKAWYQYAVCLVYKDDVSGASETLSNVFSVLKNKWDESVLSPVELNYLDKVVELLRKIEGPKNAEYERIEKQIFEKRKMSQFAEYMGLQRLQEK